MSAKRAAVIAGLVLATLAPRAALAGEPPAPAPSKEALAEAQKLFADGKRDLDAGRAAEALTKFRAVAAIKETPGVLFHVAHALEDSGKLVESLATFERAEKLARDQGVTDVLELSGKRIAPLRARVPNVDVRVAGPRVGEARVRVDGALHEGVADATGSIVVRVDPGRHRLEVVLGESVRASRELDLAVGVRQRWDVSLEPALEATAAARPAPAVKPTASPAPRPASTVRLVRWPTVATGAGALAFAGAGVSLVAVSASKNSSAADACARARGCDLRAADTVHALDRFALASFGLAAASAGLAVVLHFAQTPERRAIEARVGPGGVRVFGAF